MKFGEILVYLDDEPGAMSRLTRAAFLATSHHARLVALFGRPATSASALPSGGEPGYLDPDEIQELDRQLEQRVEAAAVPLHERFDEILKHHCLAGEWRVDIGSAENVIRHAMASDLTVLGPSRSDRPALAVPPEVVALHAGRPIVVLPPTGTHAWPPKRVLCGWNGRREAVRAIVDAMPLLITAEHVTVMTVTRSSSNNDAHPDPNIVRYLAQRSVPVDGQTAHADDGDVYREILSQAYAEECDMLVMGAYGHSRVREALTGGVTRQALERVDLPLFMSH
jgi:nucleotide-binding universal stress UspA family protein